MLKDNEMYNNSHNELIYTIYNGLPRLGPGDNASTRKAFYSLFRLDDHAHIPDIGCGKGVQTMEMLPVRGELHLSLLLSLL